MTGVVGIGASPSCGIHTTLDLPCSFDTVASCPLAQIDRNLINDRAVLACRTTGEGLFIRLLRKQLQRRGISVRYLEHDLIAEMQGIAQPLQVER